MPHIFFCSLQQSSLQIKKKNQLIYIYKTRWKRKGLLWIRWDCEARRELPNTSLQENVWESNLIPDIVGVDYFAGQKRRTNLLPLEGLPVFVDDFFVYGPLREDQIVRGRGRQAPCTTGEEGSAKRLISQISLFVREVWGDEDGYKNVAITHTVDKKSTSSRIVATVEKIEKETGHRARRRWEELHPQDEVAANFVAKVDVLELQMEKLQKGLPTLRRLLEAVGFGLYQIDYTQDFSGVLVRPALVRHLVDIHGFFQQGDFAFPENGGCILDNTGSVGNHVCTLVQTRNKRTTSTKFYNKVVSQFEAGDVRETFGGHLAHYVGSTNKHLRRTLLHPDVQRKGGTQVEISLYACEAEDLSKTVAEELVAETMELANTEEGLFVVQPPAKQWENLAQHLGRCMVLGDRPQGAIYVSWSGYSKTVRVQGMLVKPTAAKVEDDQREREQCNGRWRISDSKTVPYFRRRSLGWKAARCSFRLCAATQKSGKPSLPRATSRASCTHARPTHKICYRQQGT